MLFAQETKPIDHEAQKKSISVISGFGWNYLRMCSQTQDPITMRTLVVFFNTFLRHFGASVIVPLLNQVVFYFRSCQVDKSLRSEMMLLLKEMSLYYPRSFFESCYMHLGSCQVRRQNSALLLRIWCQTQFVFVATQNGIKLTIWFDDRKIFVHANTIGCIGYTIGEPSEGFASKIYFNRFDSWRQFMVYSTFSIDVTPQLVEHCFFISPSAILIYDIHEQKVHYFSGEEYIQMRLSQAIMPQRLRVGLNKRCVYILRDQTLAVSTVGDYLFRMEYFVQNVVVFENELAVFFKFHIIRLLPYSDILIQGSFLSLRVCKAEKTSWLILLSISKDLCVYHRIHGMITLEHRTEIQDLEILEVCVTDQICIVCYRGELWSSIRLPPVIPRHNIRKVFKTYDRIVICTHMDLLFDVSLRTLQLLPLRGPVRRISDEGILYFDDHIESLQGTVICKDRQNIMLYRCIAYDSIKDLCYLHSRKTKALVGNVLKINNARYCFQDSSKEGVWVLNSGLTYVALEDEVHKESLRSYDWMKYLVLLFRRTKVTHIKESSLLKTPILSLMDYTVRQNNTTCAPFHPFLF